MNKHITVSKMWPAQLFSVDPYSQSPGLSVSPWHIFLKFVQRYCKNKQMMHQIDRKLPSSPWWQKLRKQYSTERHDIHSHFLNSTPLQYGLAFAIKFEKRTKFYLHPYICTVSVSIWGRIWLKDDLSQKMFLDCNHYYLLSLLV